MKRAFPAMTWRLLWLLSLMCLDIHAQDEGLRLVKGKVLDTQGSPVAFATIILKDSASDQARSYGMTNAHGDFSLPISAGLACPYRISISHLQMHVLDTLVRPCIDSSGLVMRPFVMRPARLWMDEIIIQPKPLAFRQQGDTLTFLLSQYTDASVRKIEDVLRKIPGFQVGADGRIYFHGKEVDRILVDGEDITERNYRLLSRHLNASLIEKMELVSGFHRNRLMRDVSRSDKLGINLRTHQQLRDRLNKELDIAPGSSGRSSADVQLTILSKRMKSFTFLNANRTADKEGRDLLNAVVDDPTEAASEDTNSEMPIQGGRVSSPLTDRKYIRDNEDASAIQIFSMKAGKHAGIKYMAATGVSRYGNASLERTSFQMPDQKSWTWEEFRSHRQRQQEHSAKLIFSHDRQKKNQGKISLEYGTGKREAFFVDRLSGDVTDTLQDELQDGIRHARLYIEESFSLAPKLVLLVKSGFGMARFTQGLKSATARLQAYYGLPSASMLYHQALSGQQEQQDFSATIYGRGRVLDWSVTALQRLSMNTYLDSLSARETERQHLYTLQSGTTKTGTGSIAAGASFEMHEKKNWSAGGRFLVGLGCTDFLSDLQADRLKAFIYLSGIEVRRKSGLTNAFSGSLNTWRETGSPNIFIPVLLEGDATIRRPGYPLSFSDRASLSLGYHKYDFSRVQSFSAMLSLGHQSGGYVPYIQRNPLYTVIAQIPANGNMSARMHIQAEKYLDAISMKLNSSFSYLKQLGRVFVNHIPASNAMSTMVLSQTFISSFDMPLNMEMAISAERSSNSIEPDRGSKLQHTVWQNHAYLKLTGAWGDKYLLAVQCSRRQMQPGSHFIMADLYGNIRFRPSLQLNLRVHNLTDTRYIGSNTLAAGMEVRQTYPCVGRYMQLGLVWGN